MDTLFFLFSGLTILSAIMVIQASNPVHSVLFLILVFLNSAGLLLLLGLDFFAMLFLVVYVGAIAVLFLFVVMMLNVKLAEINEKKLRYLPVGGLLGVLFLIEILSIVDNDLIPLEKVTVAETKAGSLKNIDLTDFEQLSFLKSHAFLSSFSQKQNFSDREIVTLDLPSSSIQWYQLIEPHHNIESIGMVIYTYYLLYFLCASVILLVAMIGAILLTLHRGVSTKHQNVLQQNQREFAKTVLKIQ